MSAESLELLCLLPLQKLQQGQRLESTPPHLTIFPRFQIEEHLWQKIDAEITEDLIEELGGFSIAYAAEREHLGPGANVPVARINSLSLFPIHAFIKARVDSANGTYDNTYTGLEWRPHVSDKLGVSLNEGQSVAFSQLAVLRYQGPNKFVHATYNFEVQE